jgi:hypothetical protein
LRSRDFFYAHEPKKLQEGRTKYNEPKTEEAEKAVVTIAKAAESEVFQPRRDHDVLTEVLGNPEHTTRGRHTRKGSSNKATRKK